MAAIWPGTIWQPRIRTKEAKSSEKRHSRRRGDRKRRSGISLTTGQSISCGIMIRQWSRHLWNDLFSPGELVGWVDVGLFRSPAESSLLSNVSSQEGGGHSKRHHLVHMGCQASKQIRS